MIPTKFKKFYKTFHQVKSFTSHLTPQNSSIYDQPSTPLTPQIFLISLIIILPLFTAIFHEQSSKEALISFRGWRKVLCVYLPHTTQAQSQGKAQRIYAIY
ncbi:hypothetical protein ACKWTF_004654 [Chironomus riparius]